MTLPERYVIPEDRLPRAWSQVPYDCCGAASITKVLEIIYRKKLSIGYMYARNSRPDKTKGGIEYEYTIPKLLERGTVPEEMCPIMDEIPSIIERVANLPNIAELDEEAKKTRIKSYIKIKGDIHFYDNVKKCLYEHNMPLVGNMVGKRHCAVIVGWDGKKLLYHNHDGTSTLYRGRFNEAYYLDGGIEEVKAMSFTDVKKDDWFYEAVKDVFDRSIMVGTSDTEFSPNKAVTRAEMATIISRLISKGGVG